MAAAGFACICQVKEVELGTDRQLHRMIKDGELHDELARLLPGSEPGQVMYQPGGGCRAFVGAGGADASGPITLGKVDTAVAVFHGQLTNQAQLTERYAPDLPAGQACPATLLCHMYAKAGVELLAQLRGKFAFCLYESRTMRVLAATDGSGKVPLFEGRTAADSLLISSSREALQGCHDIVDFQPGDFKYGWHAVPRKWEAPKASSSSRRSLDQGNSSPALGRRSMDHSHHAPGTPPLGRRSMDVQKGHGAVAIGTPTARGRRSVDGNPLYTQPLPGSKPRGGRSSLDASGARQLPASPSDGAADASPSWHRSSLDSKDAATAAGATTPVALHQGRRKQREGSCSSGASISSRDGRDGHVTAIPEDHPLLPAGFAAPSKLNAAAPSFVPRVPLQPCVVGDATAEKVADEKPGVASLPAKGQQQQQQQQPSHHNRSGRGKEHNESQTQGQGKKDIQEAGKGKDHGKDQQHSREVARNSKQQHGRQQQQQQRTGKAAKQPQPLLQQEVDEEGWSVVQPKAKSKSPARSGRPPTAHDVEDPVGTFGSPSCAGQQTAMQVLASLAAVEAL